jgi:ABC-type uncharacterized transport system substrate-binding protein
MSRSRSLPASFSRFLGRIILPAVILGLVATNAARAHPHVMVSVRTVVILNDLGEIDALRHAWKFDEAFSNFSTTGLDKNKDGKLDRGELADLAKVNVESLGEYAYFSFVRKNKALAEFGEVKDYYLSHDGKNLTLHFTLPVTKNRIPVRDARLEVYDPSFFVAFDFEKDNPVTVEGGKLACIASVSQPDAGITARLSKMGEGFFQTMGSSANADWAAPVRFTCK